MNSAKLKVVGVNGILLVITMVVLGYILIPMIYGPFYISNRFKPPHLKVTIDEMEKKINAQLERSKHFIDNETLIIGKGPLIHWAIPSGPPMYVFDKEGILIDFSFDCGDDPEFLG